MKLLNMMKMNNSETTSPKPTTLTYQNTRWLKNVSWPDVYSDYFPTFFQLFTNGKTEKTTEFYLDLQQILELTSLSLAEKINLIKQLIQIHFLESLFINKSNWSVPYIEERFSKCALLLKKSIDNKVKIRVNKFIIEDKPAVKWNDALFETVTLDEFYKYVSSFFLEHLYKDFGLFKLQDINSDEDLKKHIKDIELLCYQLKDNVEGIIKDV